MNADARLLQPRVPRLESLRVPADASLPALMGNVHVMWRLARQARSAPGSEAGTPVEEYKSVCEFMRLYATLRFYQLALLLGTTGSIITALASSAVRSSIVHVMFLRAGGVILSLAFVVMEFRASSYWHRLRRRGNELARILRFEGFPTSSRWNPATTSGASFYLHGAVAAMWMAGLFLGFTPVS